MHLLFEPAINNYFTYLQNFVQTFSLSPITFYMCFGSIYREWRKCSSIIHQHDPNTFLKTDPVQFSTSSFLPSRNWIKVQDDQMCYKYSGIINCFHPISAPSSVHGKLRKCVDRVAEHFHKNAIKQRHNDDCKFIQTIFGFATHNFHRFAAVKMQNIIIRISPQRLHFALFKANQTEYNLATVWGWKKRRVEFAKKNANYQQGIANEKKL